MLGALWGSAMGKSIPPPVKRYARPACTLLLVITGLFAPAILQTENRPRKPTAKRRPYVLSPGSLGAEAENAVPVSTRWARAEMVDALPVESVQLHCRRGGGELPKQRFGLVPALPAEVR